MSYPLKFREKVIEIKKEEKLSREEVSKRFHIGSATVSRWLVKIEPCLKRNKPAVKIDMKALKLDVENEPDAFQRERAERLGVASNTVLYALRRLNITNKKNFKSSESR
jgi:transposase